MITVFITKVLLGGINRSELDEVTASTCVSFVTMKEPFVGQQASGTARPKGASGSH
jgi:hypothetical protein